ncbi:aldehyde dehydrogenase family protein [Paenibacillaceae bacterium WGS1546]|uniref:aldehyde dehydrogenase family protein n=1 Tax=Cohnella sp. WGS1546 TaxID=3366810 RepID=UPI00372D7EDB
MSSRTKVDRRELEMGGKNPIIVAEDADLDAAAEATVSGAFRSTGQKCTATSRAYVHRDVYDAFKERLIERIGRIKVGDGLLPDTWMGPCASEAQYRGVREYIRIGVEEGAALLCGGVPPEDAAKGYFVEPTVFEGVTPEMRIAREEIFGPVLALIKVDGVREAIGLANDSSYGLSASLFSKDVSNVFKFIDGLEAGLIRVNSETAGVELQAPFGGMKQSSSHSREQGQAAVEFFTSVKTVFIKP